MDLNIHWGSEALSPRIPLPAQEFRLFSFFETGLAGDKSFDLHSAAIRVKTGEAGHFWFGRSHPFEEDTSESLKLQQVGTSALGTSWTQNQSDALQPRVVGWIGAGWAGKVIGLPVTFALSPVFLPNFGPRLDLSENADPHGSRFATLPPLYLDAKTGQLLPMRYKVDTGDLQKIVLQNQFFFSVGYELGQSEFRLLAWSAPSPNVDAQTSGHIQTVEAEDEANALITVIPRFPRETFYGAHWGLSNGTRTITVLESAIETASGRFIVSAEFRPWSFLKGGALHTLPTRPMEEAAAPVRPSPVYAKELFWIEGQARLFRGRLLPALRAETHLSRGKEDRWLLGTLQYTPDDRLALVAAVSVLTGVDGSYFGQWRALDSISTGVRYRW